MNFLDTPWKTPRHCSKENPVPSAMILGLGNFEFRAIIKIIFGGHFFQKIFESDTDSFYVIVVAIFQGIHFQLNQVGDQLTIPPMRLRSESVDGVLFVPPCNKRLQNKTSIQALTWHVGFRGEGRTFVGEHECDYSHLVKVVEFVDDRPGR